MAELDDKNPLNVPGKYYVDTECTNCEECKEVAPTIFEEDDEGLMYVAKQPETEEELELVAEAMEGCPVESIGDDGE